MIFFYMGETKVASSCIVILGFAPLHEATNAPIPQASFKVLCKELPCKRPNTNVAKNESPAPTVSLTSIR